MHCDHLHGRHFHIRKSPSRIRKQYETSPTIVKTCGKAENNEAESGNDEAKGVLERRGVTEGDGTM